MSGYENQLRDRVRLVEVGPRDGLQNIKTTIPTSTKIELISRLRKTGLEAIELTSMVSERAVPQLADARQLLAYEKIQDFIAEENVRHPVLVPNLKGLDRALSLGVKEVAVFVSASESFSRANINCSVSDGILRARQVARQALVAGCSVRGYVSCVFACPYDGKTPKEAVSRIVKDLLNMGCYEVSLGDTLGVGTAANVLSLLNHLAESGAPVESLAGHFHDTYGQAVSNIWTSYGCGMRVFDTSVAGLGGCPYCPGASGNAATEDVVFLFENADIDTGIDVNELSKVGEWICHELGVPNRSRSGTAIGAKQENAPRPAPCDQQETPSQTRDDNSKVSSFGLDLSNVVQTCHLLWNSRHKFALPFQF